MRYALLLGMLAALTSSGCDNVKAILFAKDPLRAQESSSPPAPEEIPPSAIAGARPAKAQPADGMVQVAAAATALREEPAYRIEPVTPDDMAQVMRLSERTRQMFLARDMEGIVAESYPPLVEMCGGRDEFLRMLKAVSADAEAAGIVFESLELSNPTETHIGRTLRLCFVPTVMVAKVGEQRVRVKAYYAVFAPHGTREWYVVNAASLSPESFHFLIPGFPPDLELPEVVEEPVGEGAGQGFQLSSL